MARLGLAVALLLGSLAAYALSPVASLSDSRHMLSVSEALLHHRTPHLEVLPEFEALAAPELTDRQRLRRVREPLIWHDDHLQHYFPIGSAVLSVPLLAILEGVGLGLRDEAGRYAEARELRAQRVIAALLAAVLVVVFHGLASVYLPPGWAAAIALTGGFATQIWSTASRVLWSHTWGVLLLALALWLLARALCQGRRVPSATLAMLLAWAFFCRPTFALAALGVTVFLLLRDRAAGIRLALWGGAWLLAFAAFSQWAYGAPLPPYFGAGRFGLERFLEALAGNLVSPSRGTLVHVPPLVFALVLAWRCRGALPAPGLVWLALGVCAAHWVTISTFPQWSGGACYGPRLTTDLAPWFVLIGALAVEAARRSTPSPLRRPGWAAAGVLSVALGGAIHARGALDPATERWNERPFEVAGERSRLWRWNDAQMLAGLGGEEESPAGDAPP